jgi:anti-sigma factor ChrR (cupin superfamily)
MSATKSTRDKRHNNRIEDVYVKAGDQPWLPMYPGFSFKVLRVSPETGTWTVLLQANKGSAFPRHTHLGAGEYYMVSGKMEVRGGVENGGITALQGDYGFEPNGIIHDYTVFPVKTVLLFTNHGAVNFIDDDNKTIGILDWQEILRLEAEGKKALQRKAA